MSESATEVMRRMLDERGVEWWESNAYDYGDVYTSWESPTFGKVYATENNDGKTLFMSCLNNLDFTPEQAIAATLGGGECEVISHYYYDDYDLHEFELSCGHSYTMHDDMPYPFCPICGKKVKAVKR